jgi:hypothetical protein
MGKRSAVVELFLGDMGSMQRELRPSTQREDQLTMETKLEQIAAKAVNQLPKSVVREIRTPRSVGAGGGRPPPATRWARGNSRPYREPGPLADIRAVQCPVPSCSPAIRRRFDLNDTIMPVNRANTRPRSAPGSFIAGLLSWRQDQSITTS